MTWPKLTPARRVHKGDGGFYSALQQPGDYCRVEVQDGEETISWVYFLLPTARDDDAPAGARSIHGVRQPPHTFRECEDGSLEIRASIGCGDQPYYWHGYLDAGNVWRQLQE